MGCVSSSLNYKHNNSIRKSRSDSGTRSKRLRQHSSSSVAAADCEDSSSSVYLGLSVRSTASSIPEALRPPPLLFLSKQLSAQSLQTALTTASSIGTTTQNTHRSLVSTLNFNSNISGSGAIESDDSELEPFATHLSNSLSPLPSLLPVPVSAPEPEPEPVPVPVQVQVPESQREIVSAVSISRSMSTSVPRNLGDKSLKQHQKQQPRMRDAVSQEDSRTALGVPSEGQSPMSTSSRRPVVCVFDFDCTLSTRHVFYFLNSHAHYLTHFHCPQTNAHSYDDIFADDAMNTAEVYLQCLERVAMRMKHGMDLSPEERTLFLHETFAGDARVRALTRALTRLHVDGHCRLVIASRGIRSQILYCLRLLGWQHLFQEDDIYDRHTHKTQLLHSLLCEQHVNVVYFDDTRAEHDQLVADVVTRHQWMSLRSLTTDTSLTTTTEHSRKRLATSMMRNDHQSGNTSEDNRFDVFHWSTNGASAHGLDRNANGYVFCKCLPPNGHGLTEEILVDSLTHIQRGDWF